jgi:Holliday junction DNA helicase RuvA
VAPWRDQLTHALAGLGFTGKEAADAIDVVAADVMTANAAAGNAAAGDDGTDTSSAPDVPALLRRSIQLLGRTR